MTYNETKLVLALTRCMEKLERYEHVNVYITGTVRGYTDNRRSSKRFSSRFTNMKEP